MKRWNALVISWTLMCSFLTVRAQSQSHTPQDGAAGERGVMRVSGEHQFEVVCTSNGLQVYVRDRQGQPVQTQNVRGHVRVSSAGDPRTFRYDIYPTPTETNVSSSLYLALDSSRLGDQPATAVIELYGLSPRPVSLTAKLRRSPTPEQTAIRQQRICPVSGQLLGSMGQAPVVRIGERDIFVCCAGCTDALKARPELYLARLVAPPAPTTAADAAAIARQVNCPVTEQPLNSMGGAWRVTVEGRSLFVCCRGCIPRVQREPQRYLTKLPTVAAHVKTAR